MTKIGICQSVLQKMEDFSAEDSSRERGGMLLGEWKESTEGFCVTVRAFLPAEHTKSSVSSLTFTHRTWEEVHRQMAGKYEGLRIVGWHHTHPGYGIFLSASDLFIQAHFFDLPWQIASVTDPLSGETGFFGWKDGKTTRIEAYDVLKEGEGHG